MENVFLVKVCSLNVLIYLIYTLFQIFPVVFNV